MNPNAAVETIMSTRLITCKPDTPLAEIARIFEENGFHHLPVTNERKELLGIISKSDFARLQYFLAKRRDEVVDPDWHICAADLMTPHPLSLEPNDSIGLAADIFLANKFHALPIIEAGVLVGLVTTHDLIAYAFNTPVEESEEVSYEED
ncbi:MAG: hypothetical protein KatS3mg029_0168 [Saprospiraceae bacterium]|nr:MAG: hypothetical protein KatS3mg029_0168 [Saprospiraceae bacterium]